MEIDIRRNDGDHQELMIPYGKQSIDEEDIQAVDDVLRSCWLTTVLTIGHFETERDDFVGVKYAVAVNSGTAYAFCTHVDPRYATICFRSKVSILGYFVRYEHN